MRCGSARKIEHYFVDVTPAPPFRRIIGLDDRVFCRVKMFCGVSIWRLIATTDMATAAADPQMQPGVAQFQTFLAPQGARNNVTDCREMFAKYRHVFPTRAIRAALRLSRFQSDCEAPLRHVLERSSRKLRIDRHEGMQAIITHGIFSTDLRVQGPVSCNGACGVDRCQKIVGTRSLLQMWKRSRGLIMSCCPA
jgi:hypothetical protein